MKKFLKYCLVAVMTLGLAACSSGNGGEADKPSNGGDTPTPAGDEKLKVALVLPYIGDQSYFDITNNGLKLVAEQYGDKVETKLVEMGTDEAGWASAYLQTAQDGYDVIISGNFQYESYMLEVAADYPDVKFFNFDYSDPALNDLPNVYGVAYASQDIGYLAGVVAAVKSKSGVVGCVGGMEIGGIKQFLGGFYQGARDVNPDIKVLSGFVGDFQDTAKAKEIALNMNSQGADVIFHAAGGAGNGMIEAAAQADFWAIGVDADQHVTLANQPELANHVLTSGLKNCDQAILRAVGQILDGTAPFGTLETLGYAEDGVGVAENDFFKENMTEEEMAKFNEYATKLKNGEIEVVDCQADEAAWTELTSK